mmetsp:Transcript_14794/g.26206  ORF Transcript_14794/g.26206 Transcript_14794/m.26206 type:complete len:537 (-) Transcript_14794:59-1669(-)
MDMKNAANQAPNIPFPRKLYDLIDSEPDHLICWSAHGASFMIVDQDEFCQIVLPKYFRHTKLTSFQRQLNLYGFRRITKGPDSGAYYHAMFNRDTPENIDSIKRMVKKGGKPSNADGDHHDAYYGKHMTSQYPYLANQGGHEFGNSPNTPNGFPDSLKSQAPIHHRYEQGYEHEPDYEHDDEHDDEQDYDYQPPPQQRPAQRQHQWIPVPRRRRSGSYGFSDWHMNDKKMSGGGGGSSDSEEGEEDQMEATYSQSYSETSRGYSHGGGFGLKRPLSQSAPLASADSYMDKYPTHMPQRRNPDEASALDNHPLSLASPGGLGRTDSSASMLRCPSDLDRELRKDNLRHELEAADREGHGHGYGLGHGRGQGPQSFGNSSPKTIPSPLNHVKRLGVDGCGTAMPRTSNDGTYLQVDTGYLHPHSFTQPSPAYHQYPLPQQHAPMSSSMPVPTSSAMAAPMPINPFPTTPRHPRVHAHNWANDGIHMEHEHDDGGVNAEIEAKLGRPQSAVSDTIMSEGWEMNTDQGLDDFDFMGTFLS